MLKAIDSSVYKVPCRHRCVGWGQGGVRKVKLRPGPMNSWKGFPGWRTASAVVWGCEIRVLLGRTRFGRVLWVLTMGAGAAEVWMRIAVRVRSWREHVGVNIKGRLFLFVFLT